jgi:PTS system cellobiose-specific IIC component
MNEGFMNGLLAFAGKMQSNKILSAIKDSFIDNMPVVIMGAFCTLFQFILSATKAQGYDISLANVPGFGWLAGLWDMWGMMNYGCMNFMAVAIVFLVAMHYSENIGHAGDKTVPAVALASFVTLIDTRITYTPEGGEAISVATGVKNTYTNAQGLFVALIVGIVASTIYVKLMDSGKLKISLPDSVPPNVSHSFEVLFPSVITIFLFGVVAFCMRNFFNMTFFDVMAKVMSPVQAIMTGLPGYLVIVLIMMLLWWFGIHGPNVMSAVTTPFMTAAYAANNEAFAAGARGSALPNIICTPFGSAFFSHTGSGITGGLIIAILLFSKRDDFKAIAKLAIPCGIFNINEPIIFGIPMVMNPLLGIPFFLSPVVSVTLGYILTAIGICPRFGIDVPWTTPTGILGFLASGGNIMGGLSQLLCFATTILIYTPFVIIANSQTAEA